MGIKTAALTEPDKPAEPLKNLPTTWGLRPCIQFSPS